MSIFDKFKKGSAPVREASLEGISETYVDMLSESLAKARLNQTNFYRNVVAANPWRVDFLKGNIRFGARDTYPIQLIGSESYQENTWRWSVSNISSFPREVIEDAILFTTSRTIVKFPEISPEIVEIGELVNGHAISSVISSLHYEKVCYYRCPIDEGAVFILVKELPESIFESYETEDVAETIAQLSKQVFLNHKLMARAALRVACENVQLKGSLMTGETFDKQTISVSFDNRDKVKEIAISA